jgi:cell division protein FtsZ
VADDVLRQGVQGISDIITIPGIINRDFADVKTTMSGMGYAVMGTAVRSGANRAVEAAQAAMASPLLEAGAIDGAKGILINISGSSSLKLSEVNEASTLIQDAAHEDANIIFGAVLDESMDDDVKITVIATGFRQGMPERRVKGQDSEMAAATPYVRVEAKPSVPRFASEVANEMAERADVYASGFGSQTLNPTFERLGAPVVSSGFGGSGFNSASVSGGSGRDEELPKPEARARMEPEDSAIGGFLAELATTYDEPAPAEREPQSPRSSGYGSREEEEHLEQLDIPAFMRNGNR